MRYSQFSSPDSLGALSVGELNSPRVAPLPIPDSRLPIPYSLLPKETMNQQRQKPHYSICQGFRIPMGFPVTCFESGL
ncbi:hypothetical protein, partial [Moorena sp. SIO3B2]